MKPISMKVRAVKGNKITMSQFYKGTFVLTFSGRSPSIENQKFNVGDQFQMVLSKKNPVISKKAKPNKKSNRSRKKN